MNYIIIVKNTFKIFSHNLFYSVFITSSNPLSLLNSGSSQTPPNSQLAAALAQLASGGIGGALPANLSNLLGGASHNSSSEKQPDTNTNNNNEDDEEEEISPVE